MGEPQSMDSSQGNEALPPPCHRPVLSFSRTSLRRLLECTIAVALPTATSLILLRPLLGHPGYIFYGDENWNFAANSLTVFNPAFVPWQDWYPTSSNGLVYDCIESLTLLLGSESGNRLLTLVLAGLPGVTSFFACRMLLSRLGVPFKTAIVSAGFGSFFYVTNWQNPGMITPTTSWAINYAMMPLMFVFLTRLLDHGKRSDAVVLAVLSAVAAITPAWMIFLPVVLVTSLACGYVWRQPLENHVRNLKAVATAGAATLVFNAYWLVQAVAGFVYKIGGQYASYGTSADQLTAAQNQSFYHMIDVLMYGQPTFYSFGLNPQNWQPLALVLLCLAAFPLLVRRRGVTLTLFSLGLLGMFLAKGFNPPFGQTYSVILMLSPPGVVGLTRDVTPWLQLTALAYGFLFAVAMADAVGLTRNWFQTRTTGAGSLPSLRSQGRGSETFLRSTAQRPLRARPPRTRGLARISSQAWTRAAAVAVLGLLVLSAFVTISETARQQQNFTFPRFSPIEIPDYYRSVMRYLEEKSPTGNVLWIPTGATYSWKNGEVLSGWGPNIYSPSANPEPLYPYLFNTTESSLGRVLVSMGVSYIVYDSSGSMAYNWPVNFPPGYILSRLSNQSDLSLVATFGNASIFSNNERVAPVLAGRPVFGNNVFSVFHPDSAALPYSEIYVNTSNTYLEAIDIGHLQSGSILNLSEVPPEGLAVPARVEAVVLYDSTVTQYGFNLSILDFNSLKVTSHTMVPTVNYSIPPFDRNLSGNGRFGTSFGVRMEVYSIGAPPIWAPTPQGRLYEQLAYNQTWINDTRGSFDFTLPHCDECSIYINFFASGYRSVSPLYYVFSVVNNTPVVEPVPESPRGPPGTVNVVAGLPTLVRPYVETFSDGAMVNGSYNRSETYFVPVRAFLDPTVDPAFSKIMTTSDINAIPTFALATCTRAGSLPPFSTACHNATSVYSNSPTSFGVGFETPVQGLYNLTLVDLEGTLDYDGSPLQHGQNQFGVEVNSTLNLKVDFKSCPCALAVSLTREVIQSGVTISDLTAESPTEYVGSISTETQVLVVLTEAFSAGWRLVLGGKTYTPIPVDSGIANGFIVPHFVGGFRIYFVTQGALDEGLALSGTGGAAVFGGVAIAGFRNRRRTP